MKRNMLTTGLLALALIISAAAQGTTATEAAEKASAGYVTGSAGGGTATAKAGPSCQNIGSKSEGWYFENGLIRYDNCKDCYAVCAGSGTRSDGWYSSCDSDKRWIMYDQCAGDTTTTTLPETECRSDSDCEAFFSHCSCSYVCSRKTGEPRVDCARSCQDIAPVVKPSCSCVGGKCVQSKECVGEGEKGSMSAIAGGRCCSGLEAVSNCMSFAGGTWVVPTDGSFICARCGNGICGAGENECNCPKDCANTVEEKVTCVFTNTGQTQECYSEKGKCVAYAMRCPEGERCPSDHVSCTVNVKGKKGEVVTWKSSCGGYAKTTVDGVSEKAEFKCGGEVKPCPMPICQGVYKTGETDANGCLIYKCPTSTTLQPPQPCEIPEELQREYEALVKEYRTLLENGGTQDEMENMKEKITELKLRIEPYLEKCRTTAQKPTEPEPAMAEKNLVVYYKARMVDILSSGKDIDSQIIALKELRLEIDETIKRLLGMERINATEVQAVAGEIVVRPTELQADAVKVKTEAVMVASMGGRKIEVKPTQTGVELKDGGVAADVSEIRLSQEKVYVGGSEELKVTPSQAASAVSGSVSGIRLVTDDKNKPVYIVNAKEGKKILGLVPIEVEKKVTVDGTTNQVITEEKPWWSILTI